MKCLEMVAYDRSSAKKVEFVHFVIILGCGGHGLEAQNPDIGDLWVRIVRLIFSKNSENLEKS